MGIWKPPGVTRIRFILYLEILRPKTRVFGFEKVPRPYISLSHRAPNIEVNGPEKKGKL